METDDLMNNTLGMIIGISVLLIIVKKRKPANDEEK